MTNNERKLLLNLAKGIQGMELDAAKSLGRDPITSRSFKWRQELIDLVEAEAAKRDS